MENRWSGWDDRWHWMDGCGGRKGMDGLQHEQVGWMGWTTGCTNAREPPGGPVCSQVPLCTFPLRAEGCHRLGICGLTLPSACPAGYAWKTFMPTSTSRSAGRSPRRWLCSRRLGGDSFLGLNPVPLAQCSKCSPGGVALILVHSEVRCL